MELKIGRESRFLLTPPAFDAPIWRLPVGILPSRLVRKNSNDVATGWLKNVLKIPSFVSRERDRQTDGQTLRDGIGCAYT